jgi:superfamily II RNA helicase
MTSSYFITPDISTPPITLPQHPYTFPLDPFQQHAISAIANDENVLVCAKTGSGKTLVGEYQIYHSLSKGKRVFYTTPIKSLSNQKFNDLKHQFKDATVGIMTGDIKFSPDAQIIIMTTEILRNLLYKKGTVMENIGFTASISMDNLDAVIFDECHYINDKDRGKVWEECMILLPREINLVLLSATLNRPEYFANWLGELKQKPIHLIQTKYRIVPLTHNLIDKDYKLIQIMNENEIYDEKQYINWLRYQEKLNDEKRDYERKVNNARRMGQEGVIEGKVHIVSFTHRMNETIKMLERDNLLPALFFVLSRKQCEHYANKVDGSLLSSNDTAVVRHIISFHLHKYMKDLEITPQYHQITNLLMRGIAFHHSGLLPLLKEIVELLFSKGYIKIMFCTETFAVGLNMPTKTVLFAGFKKYDEEMDGMRMLRTDEYIQMAGRAGRRGKDDKGIVIYLPDHEPVAPFDIKAMMKGSSPPILSRMNFHYDFILKTIQVSEKDETPKWLEIMEKSYWFQQHTEHVNNLKKEIEHISKQIKDIVIEDIYYKECEKRYDLELKIKTTANAERKENQRELNRLLNKQVGPKWISAWDNYSKLQKMEKELNLLNNDLNILEKYDTTVQPYINFLERIGYITHNNHLTLTKGDLTLKGILATEINEGHQILMTELYVQELLHRLSGRDLACILAYFQKEKDNEDTIPIRELDVSQEVYEVLIKIDEIKMSYMDIESKCGYSNADYWGTSTKMIEPIGKWLDGENASVICKNYNIFEGNFIRCIMKVANTLDEWLALATYCQHTEQINKIIEVRSKMIRDIVVSDSLYLHL